MEGPVQSLNKLENELSHRKPSSHCSRALWTLPQAQTFFELSLHAQSRLPTALLLVSVPLNSQRGWSPCRTSGLGHQFMAFTSSSPEQGVYPSLPSMLSPFSLESLQRHRSWPNHFLPLLQLPVCFSYSLCCQRVLLLVFSWFSKEEFFHVCAFDVFIVWVKTPLSFIP